MRKKGMKISQETRDKVIRLSDSHAATMISGKFRISRSAVYKIRNEHKHDKELASTALAIAKDFEKIIPEPALSSEVPDCLGSTMFTDMAFTGLLNLEIIDEEKAADLFAHLKQEFSELKDIDSWKLLKISKITSTLAHRLELKAHQGKFKGRCPHCPK